MNPMERELIEHLMETLEKANKHAESIVNIDEQIIQINKHIMSVDRMLRGHEEKPGLVSRVQALERVHTTLRIWLGALAGSLVTLLAAYISKH